MSDDETRQARRARERKAETRREQFDRVHGAVLKGRTVRDMWLIYARERFEKKGLDLSDPNVRETVEHSFYAGVASMMRLMSLVGPDDITEEVGIEMLNRLHEELDTYTRKLQ